MKLVMKKCAYCKEEKLISKNGKYCKEGCSQKAKNEKRRKRRLQSKQKIEIVKCAGYNCNNTFEFIHGKRHCSKACAARSRIQTFCISCGTIFFNQQHDFCQECRKAVKVSQLKDITFTSEKYWGDLWPERTSIVGMNDFDMTTHDPLYCPFPFNELKKVDL